MQATLLHQLRSAAAEQICSSTSSKAVSVTAAAAADSVDLVDEEAVYDAAREALSALASLLGESGTGWFFGKEGPGEFDAALFSYTHLMMEYMSGEEGGVAALGRMVRGAGAGELARHRERMLEAAWPGRDVSKSG